MSLTPIVERLAVCSWSLMPDNPEGLLAPLRTIGIPRVQIALDPLREHPEVWNDYAAACQGNGITNISGMMVTLGEDYSTPESIQRTGGVVPDETWDANWRNFQRNIEIAEALDLKLVTLHAGFLPHTERDPRFGVLLDRIARIADLFGEAGLSVGFETGQETAETLIAFLSKLNRPNVGVNFDPANMILYDKGDPIEALRLLSANLYQCHIKDATRTKEAGTWGCEVAVGDGEVDWTRFLAALNEVEFTGHLAIEREAGARRVEDIVQARDRIRSLCASLS